MWDDILDFLGSIWDGFLDFFSVGFDTEVIFHPMFLISTGLSVAIMIWVLSQWKDRVDGIIWMGAVGVIAAILWAYFKVANSLDG